MVNQNPDFEGARQYALDQLETHLSAKLHYHNLYHTFEDAAPAAERLARMEGVSQEGLRLLLTAVYFHDIGFTITPDNHEVLSAHIAAQALPGFGFTHEQVRLIQGCILATKLFTPPKTQLEAIIVDADLDVLGREDFLSRNRALRREHANLGRSISDELWYAQQLHFLQIHHYRTVSAQAYRGPRKQENIRLVSSLLSRCQVQPQPSVSSVGFSIRLGKD